MQEKRVMKRRGGHQVHGMRRLTFKFFDSGRSTLGHTAVGQGFKRCLFSSPSDYKYMTYLIFKKKKNKKQNYKPEKQGMSM